MPELRSPHLDDFTLLRHVAGDLNDFERKVASRHLETCAACAAVLRQIEQLDEEMKLLARDARGDWESEPGDLPADDPFRRRPEVTNRRPARGTGGQNLAALALAASEKAGALGKQILDATRDRRRLVAILASLSLSDHANRFALLYALQEAGRQIAESPVRTLLFAEEALARLREEPAAPDATHAEIVVPRMTLLGQVHLLAGQACNWTGGFEKAQSHFQLAYRSFARGGGDEVSLALVEHLESQRRSFTGKGHEGLLLARRAVATFEALSLEDLYARAKVAEGNALFQLGRQEEAVAVYRVALPVFERQGLWSNYVGALNNIGASLQKLGRLDEARREYARALKRLSRERHRSFLAFVRHGLADVLFSAGHYREAALSLAQATRLYADCGLFAGSLAASLFEVESWARSGDLVRARHRLEIFRGQVARHGALDPSVARQIEDALSGNHPDFEKITDLRQHAKGILNERLGATPA